MICEELKIACTIQMRRFDTLLDSLEQNRGDAVMASISVTAEARKRLDFSDPYYRTPARFAARRELAMMDVRPELLEGKEIGVVAGTAHEAFLKALFTEADLRTFTHAGTIARCACDAAMSIFFSATASRWRSGSTAPTRITAALLPADRP